MTATVTYIQPKLNTLLKNSFDVAPEIKPELTLLDQGQGRKTRYLYIYRVCYLDRHSLNPTIRSLNERKKVNISSLCSKRTSLIQPILNGLLEGHTNIPDFSYIESIFDWIDREGRSADLYEVESARRLYRDYTDLIRHRLRTSSVGTTQAIGYPMAQNLQSAAAYICAQASGHDPKVVQSWAIRIPQKKMGLNELPAPATTSDEHALAYALHQRFFEAFSHAVLNNTAPPVVVNLADLGFDDLIFYSQIANNANGWSVRVKGGRTDWQPYFFKREGIFEGTASAFNKLLAEHGIPLIQDYNFKRLQDNNRRFHLSTLREMANHATRHFGHLLMSETGNNAAHLSNINCQKVRLDKAVGLATTRAIKGRSDFEPQEQHVDLRFAQTTWKLYLNLHGWISKQLEALPELGLFLLTERSDRASFSLLTSQSLRQLPFWPANAPSLATRAARKHKSVNLLEGSGGNIALVAGMQSATPQTIERHYAFKNHEEAAKAMNDYFVAQAKAAELRHKGIKVARIIKSGEMTLAGFCDSGEDEPKCIEGLDELSIEPRCGAPITCIFCTHFGLHADTLDILRLLTIKLWIEVQSRISSINIDEHFQKFAPYLNRIEQILKDLSTLNSEISQNVKNAIARFERGERDQYWAAKINALLDMQET